MVMAAAPNQGSRSFTHKSTRESEGILYHLKPSTFGVRRFNGACLFVSIILYSVFWRDLKLYALGS